MRRLTERAVTMTNYIKAKIKDRDQFRQVFPLPVDGTDTPEVAKFILSILGQTIYVRKLRSPRGTFYYVTDIDTRFVIMPSWIEYFDTQKLVLADTCVVPLILDDGTVVVMGR
jgi:hypothetical protein